MTRTDPIPPSAARGSLRDRVILAALLIAVVAGLAGLAAATGWRETLAQIARLGALQVGLLLALSLVNYGLRALRWHVLARRLGLGLGLGRNAVHYIAGFAMTVTPGRLGELVRLRWIARETGKGFERTAPLALFDRAADLAAMAILLGAAIALSASGISGALPVSVLALAAAYVVTRPRLLRGLAGRGYRTLGLWPRGFARLRRMARLLDRFAAPGAMAFAVFLGLMGWLAEAYAFHLLLVWLGADLGLAKAAAIFAFATLAGGLTGAPGGVGGAEAAMVALLTLDGVPLEVAVAATAVIRLTTLWFAIGLGLAVLPFAERHGTGKDRA